MSSIQIKVDGEVEELLDKLKSLSNINKSGISRAIAESLRTSTVERFGQTIGPDGAKWKPSIRASEGGKTLTRSSALKNSIRAKADESSFAVGTNTIYAATHQFGATRTIRARNGKYLRFQIGGEWKSVKEVTVHIPARPFLGISKEDEKEIQETIQEALE